ncbi:hypothetical protein QBC38DRAFT_362517 [Podospora fimiseda]|uniref:Chromatin structure-remodeling complex subunit RSC1 n=1 Tax=Podospora fimiseda TaxID=252190 RepID=A0AAN7BRK0_9PEZI|nr:hypothetical protein QBC38DRAFT_362517 [Podospora fimiseda]
MPTLRERPSRGENSPAKKISSYSSSPNKTRRSNNLYNMPADATSIEVRESIEAKGDIDDDVEMEDAVEYRRPATTATTTTDADADADADGDIDAEGEPDDDIEVRGGGLDDDDEEDEDEVDGQRDVLQLIKDTSEYLCRYTIKVDGEDEELAAPFQRLVNKRSLPDYFEVIKEPMAFSTIRAKLGKKTYTAFKEFVHDVTRICHNAQVYNRPSAPIFSDAGRLLEVFKEKLAELVKDGEITAEEAVIPDLGPLPEFEDSPPPEEEEEEENEDEDEEDEEDDEDEDSVDEDGRRKTRRRGRRSAPRRGGGGGEEESDPHKKRGRPPKVLAPLEARIAAVLKGLRRFKSDKGHLRIYTFERPPENAALEAIKKKHKRKRYTNVDQVLQDLEAMFEAAKQNNPPGSDLHEDAAVLQKEAQVLAEQEKAKPDDDFRDEDGKLPLTSIESKGEVWKVGDWVHIRNPNDLAKPIVAQLYQLWSDASGQKWVNACWYYRPEQTVHRFDKHFYENEVVKTGQYRDHLFEDIEDRCFVMFITRYPRGRPRGLPRDKAVYVCEARYNEDKFRFNKIKTWTSCLPEEVRDKDYEMDLFDQPRNLRKFPSPIKHFLQAESKETDDLPKPTWRSLNAPPLIGAVHRRPREPNVSKPFLSFFFHLVCVVAQAITIILHPTRSLPSLSLQMHKVNIAFASFPRFIPLRHKLTPHPPSPKESPPPAAPNTLLHNITPAPLNIGSSRVPIKMDASGPGVAGTPGNYHLPNISPAPGPPQAHYPMQHFVPRQAPPVPLHQAPPVLHPQPQQPMPMHVPPHPGMPQMQQMQPSPHYPPQAYPPQQYAQQPQAPPPPQQQPIHFQPHPTPTPTHHIAPVFDNLHPRPVHPAPVLTPSRPPMAPAQSIATLPHANAQPANVYNVPRAPEVFTLQESIDAAIPEDIHKQFDRDENGRILFFSAPPLKRPENGVSEAYAGLGHSVDYRARARQIAENRRERERKRKERDEEMARQAEAIKKRSPSQEPEAKEVPLTREQLLEKFVLEWAASMDEGTALLRESLGGWEEIKQQAREDYRGLSAKEIRDKDLRWFLEDSEKRGVITAQQKKERLEFWEKHKAETRK